MFYVKQVIILNVISYLLVNEISNFTAYTGVGFSDYGRERVRDLFFLILIKGL